MQRHHLLPQQMLNSPCFQLLIAQLGRDRIGFDDFRRNGLLLPCNFAAALRTGLPLHRGPHRSYNAMVMERVGQIEAEWGRYSARSPIMANNQALARLDLLQRALRRRLLDARRSRLVLNRQDPFRSGADFSALDAMADQLWASTGADA